METKKDIKKEIERYLKYNYSKRDVIELLKRDGYNESEISENIAVFNKVDSNYFDNLLHFLPAVLFLISALLGALYYAYTEEVTSYKIICSIVAILLIYATIRFCKNDRKFIVVTGALIIISTLYFIYLVINRILSTDYDGLIGLLIVVFLHFILIRTTYLFYKNSLKV